MRVAWLALLLAGSLGAAEIELLEPGLMRQMEEMESAVDRSFRSADGTRPAAISATRGIYLPGYGAVFSVEVNLVPVGERQPLSAHLHQRGDSRSQREKAGCPGAPSAKDARNTGPGRFGPDGLGSRLAGDAGGFALSLPLGGPFEPAEPGCDRRPASPALRRHAADH